MAGGIFGVLGIASSGLFVTQSALRTIGHNIANVNSPGYSRQRQIVAPSLSIAHPAGAIGTGVEQVTVNRMTDMFIQAQLQKQDSLSGSTDAQVNALQLVEGVLNEQDVEGISAALTRLYKAFEDLASTSDSGQPTERAALVAVSRSLIDTLSSADRQIRALQASYDRAIVDTLPEINSLSQRILELNREIVPFEALAPANDLRDQRDSLVRELAKKVDISTFEEANGSLVVMLSNGLPLVEGLSARTLVAQPNPAHPFNPLFSDVVHDDGSSQVVVTNLIGGGELGGLLAGRDTITGAAIRSLDTLAYNLAQTVNAEHATGFGLDNLGGRNFFAPLAQVEDAARLLDLDAVILASTDAIARAGAAAPAGGSPTTDNDNARDLAALRTLGTALFLPGDPPGPATGPTLSILNYAASVIGDIGQQTRTMEQSQLQHQSFLQGLENRRDEVSGVSLDEEVTNLVRLQAAFQANARVVSSVERLLQDILDMI